MTAADEVAASARAWQCVRAAVDEVLAGEASELAEESLVVALLDAAAVLHVERYGGGPSSESVAAWSDAVVTVFLLRLRDQAAGRDVRDLLEELRHTNLCGSHDDVERPFVRLRARSDTPAG